MKGLPMSVLSQKLTLRMSAIIAIGVAVVGCEKNETVGTRPLQPDPIAMNNCVENKKSQMIASREGNDVFLLLIKSECSQTNPTAFQIAECTYRYAEHMKNVDEHSTARAERECMGQFVRDGKLPEITMGIK
jgi:hypothetical protein